MLILLFNAAGALRENQFAERALVGLKVTLGSVDIFLRNSYGIEFEWISVFLKR